MGQRTKLVPPEAAAESQGLFERCLAGEAIRDVEVKRVRKDGSIVDIRLAATPMYNPDGEVWGGGVGLRRHHRPQESRTATEPDRAL
jgi:PAS domain S-box-containing protein